MSSQSKRIAILFHEGDDETSASKCVISPLSQIWKEDGHEVILLFGTENFVPADILIMHVNLSIVPDRFFFFALQYPSVVNGMVRDIRKSTFSKILVRPGDGYTGKVIAKSDLNSGGKPERDRVPGPHKHLMTRTQDYRVFDHPGEVPPEMFASDEIVVEKFLPEMEGGLYCIRNYHFFGKHVFAARMKSENPIVNGTNRYEVEQIEPDRSIEEIRRRLRFDYGKFDYVMHEGQAILLDTNKTMGMNMRSSGLGKTSLFQRLKRFRAEGLYTMFDRPAGYGLPKIVPVLTTSVAPAPSVMPIFR